MTRISSHCLAIKATAEVAYPILRISMDGKIKLQPVGQSKIARFFFRPILALLCAMLIVSLSSRAQHETHENSDVSVPIELLERPVPLRSGIGNAHEAVTSAFSDAQAYYDQGLCYLHSYVWIEAARSFHQALRIDPSIALAFVGLSDAYLGLQNPQMARAALEKAQALAANASGREQARINIRARQLDYLANPQNSDTYFAYRKAIGDALSSYPEDPWLWILLGFASEGTPAAHGQSGGVDSIAYYQMALTLSPDNFAAHHYLIHSYETIGRTREALEHADIYERLAPAVPHAHHMRGHNLRRAGHSQEALKEFMKAGELEDAYYRSENVPAQFDWHHVHNLSLLALCNQSLGKMETAEQLYRAAFSISASFDLAEFNRRAWPEFLLNRGRPEEARNAANWMIEHSRYALGRFAGHALAGRALLALNRTDEAKLELTLAEREAEQLPVALFAALPDAVQLRAEILLRDQKLGQSRKLFEQIAQQLRSIPGPDSWNEALFQLESTGRVARESRDWELAAFIAQQMLEHDPSYAGSHFAAALVAEHSSDMTSADREFALAAKLWEAADLTLPELSIIRQIAKPR